MHIDEFSFGHIRIDGTDYEHDVVLEHGKVSKRKKKPSKMFRDEFGHTPLSSKEDIPWSCQRLIVGTGAHGNLPVMEEVRREARDRNVELVIMSTREAIARLNESTEDTNAILHVTC